ncbi:ATP-binding protein [Clostridium swellfunianum]|uniref:MASE3 domain-containing sensor histidine kinase n=1 Tax=Clostridium swellfunianum TaxID=1367462 RepID=UPI00202E7B1C|nr:MASE3 domain-containing protein [Clostridium swellfunianum]MCM0650863.1 ATP-binding protein [Clostridium swellfunianum]
MDSSYVIKKQEFQKKKFKGMSGNIIFIIVTMLVSFFLSSRNYVLFHTIIQMFTSVVAFSILIVAVNTYGISRNSFFMFLGIGYAFVGIFDFIHTITYPGMNIIKSSNFNISLQAAVLAMYVEAATTLFSYKLLKSNCTSFKPCLVAKGIFFLALGAILAIFWNNIFPDIIMENYKPTAFKIMSQIAIIVMLASSAFLYYRIRKNISYSLYIYTQHSIAARILTVLFFTFGEPYNSLNVMLHVSKFMAFYYIYKALIDVGLKTPYNHLYFKLNATSRELAEENSMRRTVEEAFVSNEECYKILIENSKDAIVVLCEGNYIYANDKALNRLGVDHINDLKGRTIYDFVYEDDIEKIEDILNDISNKKSVVPFFETKIKVNNEIHHIETAAAYFINNGKPAVLAILRDLDYKEQVKKLKEDVKKSSELLNESREYNKLITEFISNISHELRTPLNVILSAVQLLNMGGVSNYPEDKTKKYLNSMKQNCYRLLKLVNNFIDISKIDSGYLELNLQNYNIVNMVEDITLSVADYVNEKGITLTFDTDTEEKIMACDFDKIERIMLNLLSNAIKFTNPGDSIFVNFTDEGEVVTISVKDTGIGIPYDKQEIIFERFRQVDKSFTRNHEGSGIGLALVKSLIEMHGGTIKLNSSIGEGSEFIITLPAAAVSYDEFEEENSYESNVERIKIEFSDIYS